jgi:hypothetical protein
MKTILRITLILLVAALVAGVFTLAVNNTSLATTGGEGGRPADASGQTIQPPTHAEGSSHDEGGAFSLAEILTTLGKLTGITASVLLIEKAIALLSKRAPRPKAA